MGFTVILLLVYAALLVLDVFAYNYGSSEEKWTAFIAVTAIMVLGTAVLAYLWITSPM